MTSIIYIDLVTDHFYPFMLDMFLVSDGLFARGMKLVPETF